MSQNRKLRKYFTLTKQLRWINNMRSGGITRFPSDGLTMHELV
jgi:hypothetical protein